MGGNDKRPTGPGGDVGGDDGGKTVRNARSNSAHSTGKLTSGDRSILEDTIRKRFAASEGKSPDGAVARGSAPDKGKLHHPNLAKPDIVVDDSFRQYLDELTVALVDPDPRRHRDLVEKLIQDQVGIRSASMHLFTPAALRLGEMWCEDTADFVEVSVASSRLSSMVSQMASGNRRRLLVPGMDRRAILARTPGTNHTLGLAIVAACFEDAGWSVDGGADHEADEEILKLIRKEKYNLFGISVGEPSSLGRCQQIIRQFGSESGNPNMRIAIGGAAVANDPQAFHESGADIIATNAIHALEAAERICTNS